MEQDRPVALTEQPTLTTRLIAAVESIAASLSTLCSQDGNSRLTKQQLAKKLNVSTRWIERHISPSLRAKKGGAAWYAEEHVREQLDGRAISPARGRITPKKVNSKTQSIEEDLRKHKAHTKAVSG